MKKTILAILLIHLAFISSALEPSEVLDKVRSELNSLKANFNQVEIYNSGEYGETSSGQMWLKAPNQFRWNYINPIPQLIVANGNKVWIYDEDLEQVTIKRQQQDQNPLYTLLNKQQTEENYTLTFESSNSTDSSSHHIKLTPKLETNEIKSVWLTVRNNEIIRIKIKNLMDNFVVFEFTEIIKNPKVESDFFEFNPPQGTDIIEDSLFNADTSLE